MVRKFKFNEEKLLKKVDFLQYKNENAREQTIVGRHHLHQREDYIKYNKICGYITKMANLISLLKPEDPFRQVISAQLLDKLFKIGLISSKNSLSQLSKVTVDSFCRRRLSSIMVRPLKMSQNLGESSQFITQGHIKVGPDTIKDPSFLVTRNMEDFVTWVDQSKIRRKISEYHGTTDDYNL